MSEQEQPGLAWRFFFALFGREKGETTAISNHKVFGTATLITSVVLVVLGHHVPWEMWGITAAFLGVAIAKSLGRVR